jgi:hypothetical protein
MLAGPSQEILLSDSAENGSVWVLQDKDRDFKGETKKKNPRRAWIGRSG